MEGVSLSNQRLGAMISPFFSIPKIVSFLTLPALAALQQTRVDMDIADEDNLYLAVALTTAVAITAATVYFLCKKEHR